MAPPTGVPMLTSAPLEEVEEADDELPVEEPLEEPLSVVALADESVVLASVEAEPEAEAELEDEDESVTVAVALLLEAELPYLQSLVSIRRSH